jgi:hypothetical protein
MPGVKSKAPVKAGKEQGAKVPRMAIAVLEQLGIEFLDVCRLGGAGTM